MNNAFPITAGAAFSGGKRLERIGVMRFLSLFGACQTPLLLIYHL